MNRHLIGITFTDDAALNDWLDQHLEDDSDGIRRRYKGEVVWAVETHQNAFEKPITLDCICTWN